MGYNFAHLRDFYIKTDIMELTLYRKWKKDTYTIGQLYIDGKYFCDTCEDKDRNLYQGMDIEWLQQKKVWCETAIPYGRYRITMKVQSPKYKDRKAYKECDGYVPRLLKVPAFDGILLHIGNWAKDSCGCILVGKNTVKGAVTNSTVWYYKLWHVLKDADDRGEEIWITIQP